MRISNNNNITFGAHFKNNQLLKEVFGDSEGRVNSKLLDQFVKECPNHEIEILSVNNHPSTRNYKVFNNKTNVMGNIETTNFLNPLNGIIYSLVEWAKDEKRYNMNGFWRNDRVTETFKMLTGNK